MNYDTLPSEVKQILGTLDEDKDLYQECNRINKELNLINYSCEWGLDGAITEVNYPPTAEPMNGLYAPYYKMKQNENNKKGF